jgi:hypothetical protein
MRARRERTGVELGQSLEGTVIGLVGEPQGDRPLPGGETVRIPIPVSSPRRHEWIMRMLSI